MKRILIFCVFITVTCNIFSIVVDLENQMFDGVIDGELLLFKRNNYFVEVNDNLYIINKKIVKNLDKFKDNEMNILLKRSSNKRINYFFFKNVIKMNKKHINGVLLTQKEKRQYTCPNLKLLPISFITFALTYDYFKEASEIKKVIEDLEELNVKPEKSLIRKMNRKNTFGYIFLGAGIINTFISFNKVELHVEPNELWLSYKF